MRSFPVTISRQAVTIIQVAAIQLEVGNVIMSAGGWAEVTNVVIMDSPATEVIISRRLLDSKIEGTVSYRPFRKVAVRV